MADSILIDDLMSDPDNGPWRSDVDEIAVGDKLTRSVQRSEGTTEEVEVVIASITEVLENTYTISFHETGGSK